MALSGFAIDVTYYAWDNNNSVGKTGDDTNHTLRLARDGVLITPSGSPSELDSTNCPGLYNLALSATEHTGNSFTLHGKSSTSGITIIPRAWTTESGMLGGIEALAAAGL